MKLVTKIATIATLASFMFAGVNLTWGNNYSRAVDDQGAVTGDMAAGSSFGVHFDVNDNTTLGWEGGLMVGLAGPAGMTFRLGYEETTTLGVGRSWWSSTGAGWATSLNTTIDFTLTSSTDDNGTANDLTDDVTTPAGDFTVGVNLGFGF